MEVSTDTVDEDRISNLPSCIIDLILSSLPVRDVLRTSILSTKWRYKWTTVPKLVFVEDSLHPSMRNGESSKALANTVNRVLLLHTGPIEVLHVLDLRGISDIDQWIISVSRKGIKEFVLKLHGTSYTLHSSLYNCQSLVTLRLSGCSLRPPLYFTGWKSLKSLYLEHVTPFDGNPYEGDDAFENMISSCPLLESLSLIPPHEGNLHINAPNLQYLNIVGTFCNITMGCTLPKLAFLSINQYLGDEDQDSAYKEDSLTEFFINVPHVHRLALKDRFIKSLTTVGKIPERLPFPLSDLHHLDIWFDIDDQRQNLAALCLFKSSPDLREIVITLMGATRSGNSTSSVWKCSGERRCIFEKLRFVTIRFTFVWEVDFALVKFMLAESLVLEKMTFIDSACRETVPWKSVLEFKRASAKAEIIFR